MPRLEKMLENVVRRWQDLELTKSLASLETFTELLGLAKLPAYFLSCKAQDIEDWSTVPLSQEGLDLQKHINECSEV